MGLRNLDLDRDPTNRAVPKNLLRQKCRFRRTTRQGPRTFHRLLHDRLTQQVRWKPTEPRSVTALARLEAQHMSADHRIPSQPVTLENPDENAILRESAARGEAVVTRN